jgi:hypothetical protein
MPQLTFSRTAKSKWPTHIAARFISALSLEAVDSSDPTSQGALVRQHGITLGHELSVWKIPTESLIGRTPRKIHLSITLAHQPPLAKMTANILNPTPRLTFRGPRHFNDLPCLHP